MKFHVLVTRIALLIAVGVLTACEPSAFDAEHHLKLKDAYDVTIHRDNLGVPHVFGETDADAAFGLAYAQSEDHWRLIEEQIPFYRGTNASYNGPDAAVTDYLVKLLKIWPTIEARYEQDIDAETRRYIKGFADGLNYYAAKHPEQILEPSMLPITEHDIVAGNMLRHLLFYGFDRTMRELTGSERARAVSRPGDGVVAHRDAVAGTEHVDMRDRLQRVCDEGEAIGVAFQFAPGQQRQRGGVCRPEDSVAS